MEAFDARTFRAEHPEFCDPAKIRVPGLGSAPPTEGEMPFDGAASALAGVLKDPGTLPGLLKLGPEAAGFYRSFRFGDPWGIFLRRGAVVAIKEEFHRMIMRALKGHMDRAPGDEGGPVEGPVDQREFDVTVDILVSQLHFRHAVDGAAAQRELWEGERKYATYQETYWRE